MPPSRSSLGEAYRRVVFWPPYLHVLGAGTMCSLESMVSQEDRHGVLIADARAKALNSNVSFSIFTQRFASVGNPYPRLIETPVFAHSENHAMLQICDILCSAVLAPMAAYTYCLGHVLNVHVSPGYRVIKERYGKRLRALQYSYQDSGSLWRGGISVTDPIGGKRSVDLFFV